jgi:hypothetical protein
MTIKRVNVGKVTSDKHSDDTFHCLRGSDIEKGDSSVGNRTAKYFGIQHSRNFKIANILSPTAQLDWTIYASVTCTYSSGLNGGVTFIEG